MPISVNWVTGVIFVPKSDTVLLGTDPITSREIRSYDTLNFHKELREALESEEGRPGFPNTHFFDAESIIDGINYAAKITMNSAYYTVEFENGSYRVVLENTNNNIAGVAVINNVSVQPTNAAGLVGSEDIRNQSFLNAEVVINIDKGETGVVYPRGTPPIPVNNYQDAYMIATVRNYDKYHLDGILAFLITDDIIGFNFRGNSPISSIIIINNQDIDGLVGERVGVTGVMSPIPTSKRASFNQCAIGNITNFWGIAAQSVINGTLTMYNGSITGQEIILDYCSSGIGGNTKPEYNLNGMSNSFQLRHYQGGAKITNSTHPDCKISIDGSGRLEFDATNTEGEAVVGPGFSVIDNSGPNFNVIITETTTETEIIQWARKASDNAEQANLKL